MSELEIVRTCALLHDIGKLECWANRQPWSKHIYYTYRFVKECLGEELALHAMRHHTGLSYPKEDKPQTLVEKIVCLADNIASGADRPEEPGRGTPVPSPPIKLTHVLSEEKVRKKLDARELAYLSQKIKLKLGNLERKFAENPRDTYFRNIFKVLENDGESELRFVPADTREHINDVSLWDHLKLTAAFATCIYREGWKGDSPKDYKFALISGDADKISNFINQSLRLPDLRARSELIKKATEETREHLSIFLGPECVLFAAGGSFLALCPPELAEKALEEARERFEKATRGRVSITVSYTVKRGDEFLKNFGGIWESSHRQMRLEKSRRLLIDEVVIDENLEVCDVCKMKPWTREDEQRVLPTVPPRKERLCESCWELRKSGKGVWLNDLKENECNYVACIRADGDDIGRVLSGRNFREENKASTPSRISTLSDIIHRTCEKELEEIAKRFRGRPVFAGGDDFLAFTPGKVGLKVAREAASKFREEMAGKCTMSAGVAIFHYKLPVYVGVEVAGYLLKRAKECGKDKVAFAVIGGSGVTSSELEKIKPRTWNELDTILEIVDSMRKRDVASSQLRRIAETASKNCDEAEILIKYQMGREIIPWQKGKRFLSYLETGLFSDAFLIYNLFKGD